MNTTPTYSSREMVSILKAKGFVVVRQRGSHIHLTKGDRTVTVPAGRKDLKPGTARSICKQAGLPWPPT